MGGGGNIFGHYQKVIKGARVGGGGRRCKEPDQGENGGGGKEECARRAHDFIHFGAKCYSIPPNRRKRL